MKRLLIIPAGNLFNNENSYKNEKYILFIYINGCHKLFN